MSFLIENYLIILAWVIFIPAIYYKSIAAIVYGLLIIMHPLIFDPESVLNYALSAGVFTFAGMIACYYFKEDATDDIALFLYAIGLGTLALNIVTALMWYFYFDLAVLNVVFAGASILSIIAIIAGGRRGHPIKRINTQRASNQRLRRVSSMASIKVYTK